MEFLIENRYMICVAVILAVGAVIAIVKFTKMSAQEREGIIRAWMLQAVIAAEQKFGGKTGAVKLSYVYDKFCERFPKFAKAVPFVTFQAYVDMALEEMRKLILENEAIASIVEQKD